MLAITARSNICTAQVLLAVMASMYAVYHGPEGLRRIAERVHTLAVLLAQAVTRLGYRVVHASFFDTLCVEVESWVLPRLLDAARARRINLRVISPTRIGISLDEATALGDLADLVTAFSLNEVLPFMVEDLGAKADPSIPESLHRTSSYLTHPVFHRYRSETEMLRYIKRLEGRDLSLTSAMIPLGSCTMKLNATTEMDHSRCERQVAPFEPLDVAQHLRLGAVAMEHRVRQVGRGAVQRLGDRGVGFRAEVFHHEGQHLVERERRDEVGEVAQRRGLVERDADPGGGDDPQVDAARPGGVEQARQDPGLHFHAQRVEERRMHDAVAEPGHGLREQDGEGVHALGDAAQPFGPVIHGVHARHHGEEHLRGADVARGLLAPDVLLARLQRHAERGTARGIARYADDAAGHVAPMGLPRREERGVRAAVAHRYAEPL